MTEQAERVRNEVQQPSEQDRAELAHLPLESLEDTEDLNVEAAWNEELATRLKRINDGEAHLRPAHQVLAEIRNKYE